MTTRIVYTAELDHKHFLTGVRGVEGGAQRLVSAQQRVELAFRHFARGNIGQGFAHLGNAAVQVASKFRDLGMHAFEAGRKIVGGLQGGLSILTRYLAIGGLVTGILGGVATKLTILDSAKFDSTIGRTALQSGATPEERRRLATTARDIGVETPFGPQAVANTMKAGAQRGWNVDQIVKMTDAVKRLAVVADMDLEQAGEVLSQVMFQFDLPMEKATETALKLANATVATSLAGNELFDALKFAGGAAGVFKVNLSELLAVLGTLRRVADASTASTSLRNIMLVASAIKAKDPKKLAELGLDEEDSKKLTFMTGDPKGIVDVVKHLKGVFASDPELVMKAGFGTRTLVALEQIANTADRAGDIFGTLQARIDDVDEAQRQYSESIVLADNLFRRLETTAGAVFLAIGSKIREAFGVDDKVGAMGAQLADLAKTLEAIPVENVSAIVESLGAGLIQAFGTAIAFLARALIPVAIGFGDLLFRGIAEAAKSMLSSDEYRSYVDEYRGLSASEREAERVRLGRYFGQAGGVNENTPTTTFGVASEEERMMRRRAAAILLFTQRQSGIDGTMQYALDGIRNAGAQAMNDLQGNATVLAVQDALRTAGDVRARQAEAEAAALYAPKGGAGPLDGVINNHGVLNVYGASSASARSRPARPSGTTSHAKAAR